MSLEKRRARDLQRVDQLGARCISGTYLIGGEPARWQPYEWLWQAGYLERAGEALVLTEKGERTVADPVEREWLLTVTLRPPRSAVHTLPEAAAKDIYAYRRAVGPVHPSADGDDQLFLEDVARLAAVRTYVDEDRIWLRAGHRIFNLATGEDFTGEESSLFRWGPVSPAEEALTPIPAEEAASTYHRLATFHHHAGRKTALAIAEFDALATAIKEVAPPSGKVIVKVTRPKYAIVTLDVSDGVYEALTESDALMGALMHLDGYRDAFLVQEHVEMTFERRFFVVDHLAVTSAGCIEEYHPYSRVTRHSDPRMRRRRGDSDIVWAEQQTALLNDFARTVARDIKQGPWRDKLTEYVLDVALGADDKPLIVELNGIRNAGLYAADYGNVIQVLTDRSDVWGRAPHARARTKVDVPAGGE